MRRDRPPLDGVPMFAPCPACRNVLRARVDLTRPRVTGRLDCPWCHRRVTVHGPR